MTDSERDLRDMMNRTADGVRHVPRPSRRLVRRARVARARTAVIAGTATLALVIGGFAGARSLTSDEALPTADEDSNVNPFVGTWTSKDVDGSAQTVTIRALGEDDAEITVHDELAGISFFREDRNGEWVPVVKDVCSGSPATITGTGQIYGGSTKLAIPSPVITCDDGSEPKAVDDLPPLEEQLRYLTFEYEAETDILTDSAGAGMGLASVWNRVDAESRIGDVSGWITYGDRRGTWALDLTSPGDPADRVLLSSTPGVPIAWSPDGSKLLVSRDVKGSDSGDWPEADLFVLNSDGTETHLAHANGMVTGGSFSPDGRSVVYAVQGDRSSISVVDASGGTPDVLRTHEWRSARVCCLYGATFSPDGTQIAYFEGMYDHSNTLQVMNADGSGSRTLIEQEYGHVRGLQWSPDGSRLVFASGGMWVVGADGTGLKQVSSEEFDDADPHWSPDGSHIAYTRSEDDRESLEIVRVDDLKVQNFGSGESGLWTAEMEWSASAP